MLRLLTLILMFAEITGKAQVAGQITNDQIDHNDTTITVSPYDFKSNCKACNYDINCVNQKYDNKYIIISGDLFFDSTPLKSLGNIIQVKGVLILDNARNLKDLGHLKSVEGMLDLNNTQISTLGKLEYVGGSLHLENTTLSSLGNLKKVGSFLELNNQQITTLGNLESVGERLDVYNTPIISLGNLQSVGNTLILYNTQVESFGNLKYVGGDLNIEKTPLSKKYSEEEILEIVKVSGKIYGEPKNLTISIPPKPFINLWRTEQKWSGIDDPSVKEKNMHEQLRIQFLYRNGNYFVNLEGWESALFTTSSRPEEPNKMGLVDEDGNSFYSISIENSKFHLHRLTFGAMPEMNLILKPIVISKTHPTIPKSYKKH